MNTSALNIITTMVIFMSVSKVNLAAEQSLIIPFTLQSESNPTLLLSNEKSVNRATLSPRYSISSNDETNTWSAILIARVARSSDQAIIQDRDDPSINLAWTHHYETGQFGVTGLSSEQSTRVSEFTDSGLVSSDNTRKTHSSSVKWQNSLNDKTSLEIGADVTNVSFEGAVTTGLVDFRNEAVNTRLNHSVSEKLNTFASLSSSHFLPENISANEATTNAINIGLTWNASEKFNINTSAGLNETKYKDNLLPLDKSWQAMFSMRYSALRLSSRLNFFRSQLPSSLGSLNETRGIAVGWTYSLSEKANFDFDMSWRQNLSLNKTETSRFTAKYTKQISLSWDFNLTTDYRRSEFGAGEASSASIMTGITYKLPEF